MKPVEFLRIFTLRRFGYCLPLFRLTILTQSCARVSDFCHYLAGFQLLRLSLKRTPTMDAGI